MESTLSGITFSSLKQGVNYLFYDMANVFTLISKFAYTFFGGVAPNSINPLSATPLSFVTLSSFENCIQKRHHENLHGLPPMCKCAVMFKSSIFTLLIYFSVSILALKNVEG